MSFELFELYDRTLYFPQIPQIDTDSPTLISVHIRAIYATHQRKPDTLHSASGLTLLTHRYKIP